MAVDLGGIVQFCKRCVRQAQRLYEKSSTCMENLAPFQRPSRLDVEKNYRVEFAHREKWGRVFWPAALSPR